MRLSAVIQLIDAFSGLPAVGRKPQFVLNGHAVLPLSKPQAFYAFSDLVPGEQHLQIADALFFSEQLAFSVPLTLPLAQAIIVCSLQPNPRYPYPDGATMLRGLIRQAGSGQPLADVLVSADYQTRQRKAVKRQTRSFDQGRYQGRYALALRGNGATDGAVSLVISKTGYASVEKHLQVAPGTTTFVDIQMQQS
jgi:hypothetical protein